MRTIVAYLLSSEDNQYGYLEIRFFPATSHHIPLPHFSLVDSLILYVM